MLGIRTIVITVTIVAVTGAAGCSSHAAPPTAAPSTTSPSPTPSPVPSPTSTLAVEQAQVQAAITAYRGMWNTYVLNARHPNPDDPALRTYATGDALNVFVTGLASIKQQGLAGKGTVTLNPKPDDIELQDAPPLVGIADCVNTAASHLFKVNGSAYHDAAGGRQLASAQVRLIGGTWKITEFALSSKVGSC